MFNFRENELHINKENEDAVLFSFYLKNELQTMNRMQKDSMDNTLNRLYLNIKKKKLLKNITERVTVKDTNKKGNHSIKFLLKLVQN